MLGHNFINFFNVAVNHAKLAREKVVSDDGGCKVIPMNRNNTTEKVLAGLEYLAEQSVEAYLKEVFEKAKRQVELKLKAEMPEKVAKKSRG